MAGIAAIAGFVETVKRGGFAGAARALGLSPSAVAKSVARLESDLGVALLHRTTRQVRLTGDGRALYERCLHIVEEMDALREQAEGVRGEPVGTLRLNLPLSFGKQVIVPILAELVGRHRRIALDLAFSDRQVDLIGEGFDAVVRIGILRDSQLRARRIGDQQLLVLASPGYLHANVMPESPQALAQHRCLVFRLPSTGRPRPWQFRDARRRFEWHPDPRIVFDEGEALIAAAVSGLGIVQVPDYMAASALGTGTLVELLARYRPPSTPISLIYPAQRRLAPRMKVLIAALTPRAVR